MSAAEQKSACGAHLTLPGMVPGELLEVDEDDETISYKMRDGSVWVDGAVECETKDDK